MTASKILFSALVAIFCSPTLASSDSTKKKATTPKPHLFIGDAAPECADQLRAILGADFANLVIGTLQRFSESLKGTAPVVTDERSWKTIRSIAGTHIAQAGDELALFTQNDLAERGMSGQPTGLRTVDLLERHGQVVLVGGMAISGHGAGTYRLEFRRVGGQGLEGFALNCPTGKCVRSELPDDQGTIFYADGPNAVDVFWLSPARRFSGEASAGGSVVFHTRFAYPITSLSLDLMNESGLPLIEFILASPKKKKPSSAVFDLRQAWKVSKPEGLCFRSMPMLSEGEAGPTTTVFKLGTGQDDYLLMQYDGDKFTGVRTVTNSAAAGINSVSIAPKGDSFRGMQVTRQGRHIHLLSSPTNGSRRSGGAERRNYLVVPSTEMHRKVVAESNKSDQKTATYPAPFRQGEFSLSIEAARQIPWDQEEDDLLLLENAPPQTGHHTRQTKQLSYNLISLGGKVGYAKFDLFGLKIQSVSRTHPVVGSLGRYVIFAKVKGNGKQTLDLVYDTRSMSGVLIPTIERRVDLSEGKRVVLLATGTGKHPDRKFAFAFRPYQHDFSLVINGTRNECLNFAESVHPSTSIAQKLKFANPILLPFRGPVSDIEVEDWGPSHTILTGNTPKNFSFARVTFMALNHVLSDNDASATWLLDPYFQQTVTPANSSSRHILAAKKLVTGTAIPPKDIDLVDGATTMGVAFQSYGKGTGPISVFEFPGEVTGAEAVGRESLRLQGTYSGVTENSPSEVLIDQGTGSIEYSVVNISSKPLYEDNEIAVYGSQSIGEFAAKAVIRDKKTGEISEAGLTEFQTEADPNGAGDEQRRLVRFLDMLSSYFGRDFTSLFQERVPLLDVVGVEREKDLLMVRTQVIDVPAEITFFYSLKRKRSVFLLPNFAKIQRINEKLFVLGQASSMSESVIGVFSDRDQRLLEFFRLGQLNVAINDQGQFLDFPDGRKGLLRISVKGGHPRVYNDRLGSFQGLLPPALAAEAQQLAGEIGVELNSLFFASPPTPAFQRSSESAALNRALPLTRNATSNRKVLLTGTAGSGVDELIHNYIGDYISGTLKPIPEVRVVFLRLDKTKLTGGTMFRGQFSDKWIKLGNFVRVARDSGYRVALVIPGLHAYLRQGGYSYDDKEGDVLGQLTSFLSGSSGVDVLASLDSSMVDRFEREAPELFEMFTRMRIQSLSREQTVAAVRDYLRYRNQMDAVPVQLADSDVKWLVERVSSLSPNASLPGPVVKLVDGLIRDTHLERQASTGPLVISRERLVGALANLTGVPGRLLGATENLDDFETWMNQRVKFQTEAIAKLAGRLRAFRQELNRTDWPVARLMFAGPTGIGKTEIVRALVEFLFDGKTEPLLKISGEDYQDPRQVPALKRLILTHVRNYPFNVLLLDEWEKMHPDAQNLILSLGDGMMTGEDGRKVSSVLSLVIATSNVGSDRVAHMLRAADFGFSGETSGPVSEDQIYASGISREAVREQYQKAMDEEISAAVLNRFDVVIFNALPRWIRRGLIEAYLNSEGGQATTSIRSRLAQRGVQVEFDPSLVEYLLDAYNDIRFGARGLDRFIEDELVSGFLALKLDRGEMLPGKKYRVWYEASLKFQEL